MRRIQTLLYMLSLCVIAGCGLKNAESKNANPEMEGVPITVSSATTREMVRQLATTGSLVPFAEAAVVSEVAGVIEDLLVERGQTIKKGDKIAVVEHAEAAARVQEANAALQAAKAQLLQAEARLRNVEVEHERIISLFKDGVASQQMLDGYDANREVAIATKEVAVAQVAQAEAAVQQAQVFLENHTIRAPINGIVTVRYVDEGDKNNPSEPIVSIAQTNPLKVLCDFPERDLPFLHMGQKASLEVDAYPDEQFPAEVKIINPSMDPAARTVGVELWAANTGNRLRSGMFARVIIRGDNIEVLAVPDDAVTRMPGTGVEFLFLIDGNRTARRVDVKTSMKAEGWTGVSGEIHAGDQVAIEGQNNLKTGSRVRIVTTTVK